MCIRDSTYTHTHTHTHPPPHTPLYQLLWKTCHGHFKNVLSRFSVFNWSLSQNRYNISLFLLFLPEFYFFSPSIGSSTSTETRRRRKDRAEMKLKAGHAKHQKTVQPITDADRLSDNWLSAEQRNRLELEVISFDQYVLCLLSVSDESASIHSTK